MSAPVSDRWADAVAAARFAAVDPGMPVLLRGPAGPVRDLWLAIFKASLPGGLPWRRLPAGCPEARLLGGLDLAASLAAGRPVAARGLLAEAHGGTLLIASAERLDMRSAAHVASALDTGGVQVEREGVGGAVAARFGLVLLDEGDGPDEQVPDALLERAALRLDLSALRPQDCSAPGEGATAVAAARRRLRATVAEHEVVAALTEAADALGIAGLRAPLFALRLARASAAWAGREAAGADDVAAAARLVLGPRAHRLPAPARERTETMAGDAPSGSPRPEGVSESEARVSGAPQDLAALEEIAVAAVRASLASRLLQDVSQTERPGRERRQSGARSGAGSVFGRRGQPVGARSGTLDGGAKLHLSATLRAAAPWQRLRGRAPGTRLQIRRDDIRIARFRERTRTTTIFAVDASGSAAFGRLAEAKGAVEILLAECYIRRDDVALIGFRGTAADLLLPPTRSLARVRRQLADLPGGGATPLAAGIDAALDLARVVERGGRKPLLALLTDGRANVARNGVADRARARADSLVAARVLRASGVAAVVIDVSPRPSRDAARLADEMGARYVPLPHGDATGIAAAVGVLPGRAP